MHTQTDKGHRRVEVFLFKHSGTLSTILMTLDDTGPLQDSTGYRIPRHMTLPRLNLHPPTLVGNRSKTITFLQRPLGRLEVRVF